MNKDKIQKIIATLLVMIVILYSYYTFLLQPQGAKILDLKKKIAAIEEETRKAQGLILRVQSMEEQGAEASDFLQKADEFFPTGAPIAWFPPMMRAFFERQGIEKVTISSKGSESLGGEGLQGLERLVWDIQMPAVDFLKAGIAIAGLENEQPFASISSISIERTNDDLAYQRVGFELHFTDKKD